MKPPINPNNITPRNPNGKLAAALNGYREATTELQHLQQAAKKRKRELAELADRLNAMTGEEPDFPDLAKQHGAVKQALAVLRQRVEAQRNTVQKRRDGVENVLLTITTHRQRMRAAYSEAQRQQAILTELARKAQAAKGSYDAALSEAKRWEAMINDEA